MWFSIFSLCFSLFSVICSLHLFFDIRKKQKGTRIKRDRNYTGMMEPKTLSAEELPEHKRSI